MQPKVSVIIPVYNVEKYLQQCLESVINQTLQEIEIVCVNDGSKDNSLKILQEYEKKDSRIVLLTQENRGQSAARNNGMAVARGEFIYFLDSDDCIAEQTLKKLYDKASQEDLDILFFGAKSFYENDQLKERHASFTEYYYRRSGHQSPVPGPELLRDFAVNGEFRASVPLQFFKSSFLRKSAIRFKEGIICEDELFSALVLLYASRVASITDNLYFRRVRESSTMTQEVTRRKFDGQFVVFAELLAEYINNGWADNAGGEGLMRRVNSLYSATTKTYAALSNFERAHLLEKASQGVRFLFREMDYPKLLIAEHADDETALKENGENQQIQMLLSKVRCLDSEIKAIHDSATYKIGRIITFFPRKIRGGIRCYQEHGFRYTFHRLLVHMGIDVYSIEQKRVKKQKDRKAKAMSTKDGIAISVIIPVYNAESYLRQCLDSILNQTSQSYEVICVDDGSTDQSLAILQEYEKEYPQVKVLTQKNQYAGIARNNGMKEASGEYFLFIDADDFIDENLIALTYAEAKKNNADVVLFGADIYDHHKETLSPAPWLLAKEYLPDKPFFNAQDMPDYIFAVTTGGPCNKIFRRKFIQQQNLQFPPFRSSNDLGFVYSACALADRIAAVNLSLYHIRRSHGTNLSATRDQTPKLFFKAYEGLQKKLQEENLYQLVERSFVNRALGGCMWEMSTLKNEAARDEVEKLFINEYRHKFDISGKPAEYFFYTERYKEYQKMLKKHGKK